MIFVGIFLRDQIFAGGDEVVKNILLLLQHASAMPVFAELGAPAQVSDSVNAAVLHPEIHAAIKSRLQRDIETAVASEQGGVLAILLDSLFVNDKHRNFRSVFRVVPNLLHVISGRIE